MKLKEFDAFPKVKIYPGLSLSLGGKQLSRTSRSWWAFMPGVITGTWLFGVSVVLRRRCLCVGRGGRLEEVRDYNQPRLKHELFVDDVVQDVFQINLDMSIKMPCQCNSILTANINRRGRKDVSVDLFDLSSVTIHEDEQIQKIPIDYYSEVDKNSPEKHYR